MTDWSQIVQQHGPKVWKTIHRLLHNDADAADCFQRTFISALEVAQRETVRHWPGLLQRLATARALECLRQRRRDSQRCTALLEETVIDQKGVGPVQAAQASELAASLREALRELDADQAQVFCLTCLEGFSYQEIAAQLGLTVNHVGVLLHRAKEHLRERLQAYHSACVVPHQEQETQP